MFRKIIIFIDLVVIVNLVLWSGANWVRAISLHTAFLWLLGVAALAAPAMILMAIDSERKWREDCKQQGISL